MLRLIRWLEGYVIFAILGERPAEALTLAARTGVTLFWVREQDGIPVACCTPGDYRRLAARLRKRAKRRKPRTLQPSTAAAPLAAQEAWWETLLREAEPERTPEPPPSRLERILSGKPPQWIVRRVRARNRRRTRGLAALQTDCCVRAELRGKNALTLRVLKRKGLSFRLRRYRKRLGIPVGLVLAVSMLLVLRGFVWDVTVSGNERLPTGVYLETLARHGLAVGVRKGSVDTQRLVNQAALEHPEIGWMAVNLVGNRAYVQVSERDLPPASLEKDVPCNLVASTDGRIVAVNAFGGQKAVQPGDWVAQGDLLVSGVFEAFLGGTHLVHAWGEVQAEVSHTLRVEIPMNRREWNTSDVQVVHTLQLLGGAALPLGRAPEGDWVCTKTSGTLSLFGVRLPVRLTTAVYNRVEPVERARTETEAAALAETLMQKKKTLLLGTGKIVSEQEQGWVEEGRYVLECRIIILQNIAREQEIYVSAPVQSPSA